MKGLLSIHCQGVHRQRAARAALPLTETEHHPSLTDAAGWLPIRSGCILGTVRFLPYLGGFSFAVEQNLLWVDAAERPDMYDLARVLRQEGSGEAICGWSQARDDMGGAGCVLEVEIRRPVRTSFGIHFSLPEDLRLLASIAYTQSVILSFGDPPDIRDSGAHIAARQLREMLHHDESERLLLTFDWHAQEELHLRLVRWMKKENR